MADFYKMVLRLEAENDRLHKQLDQSTRKIQRFEKSSDTALKSVKANFAKLGAAIGGAVTIGGITALTSNSLAAADNIGKLSTRLGASTEALSQYQYVAELTGVSFNTLTTGWQRMTRRISEAAVGTGEARGALAELGLEVQALSQLAPEQQFEALADAIQQVEKPADRVRLAMKLFDSEGVALLQTMEGGSEAIRRMRDEASSLGLTLSQETADAAANANDALTRLGAATDALGLVLVDSLAPYLAEVVEWLQNKLPAAIQVASDSANFLRAELLETVGGGASLLSDFLGFLSKPVIGDPNDAVTRWLRETSKDLEDVSENARRAAESFNEAIGSTETKRASLERGVSFNQIYNANIAAAAAGARRPRTTQPVTQRAPVGAPTAEADDLKESFDEHVELYSRLRSEAASLTEAVQTPWERAADELDRYDELLELNLITQDTWARAVNQAVDNNADAVRELVDETEKADEAWRDLGYTFSSAFEDAIVDGKGLSDILKGIEQDIIRIAARRLVTEPLGNFISAGATNLFSSFGFGGARAMGGPVAAGVPYIVGERGPEMFVSPKPGAIIPNVAGNTININVTGSGQAGSSASDGQLAARIGSAVSRALRRNA